MSLFQQLFGPSCRTRQAARVPEGVRIYAVGDIHGRADLLGRMAELIAADGHERPARESLTIFLGDYLDRGPDSAGVIERLARADFPTPIRTLSGNHEDVLRQFLSGEVGLDRLFDVGGGPTLASYKLDLAWLKRRDPNARRDAVAEAMPERHRRFLHDLGFSVTLGDYFFCHAGVRPGVPLDAQDPQDLMWIRGPFLKSEEDFGKIVVHGHTPVPKPDVRPNGINVDTKAFASGHLTALVLEETERRFLVTRGK